MRTELFASLYFCAAAVPAFAQPVSIGLKIGTPLTDIVNTNRYEIGGFPFEATVTPFAIGPVLDIRLPLGFGVEFGAIYKRFGQQAGQEQDIAEPGTPFQVKRSPYSQTGQSWELPLTAQYRFPGSVIRLYLEAGVSFNRLSSLFAPFVTHSQPGTYKPDHYTEDRRGPVVGRGIEFKLPFMRVTPRLRYTPYGQAEFWLPRVNAIDFLVGFTF